MSARVFAPAKINLTLEVGPPRADGRHPLQSVAAFADAGDWLEARAGDELTLFVTGPFAAQLAGEADNLVLRAARALQAAAGVAHGAALVLEKHLPVASGIGGGSSDAAAALKALNALWKLDFSETALAEIGARLGADVPVCVGARSAFMTGAGERFAPMAVPGFDVVLVNPLQPLSTAAVYRQFDAMGAGGEFAPAPRWPDRAAALYDIARIGNALEPPARALMPAIEQVFASLSGAEGVLHAALSGSGATVFALMRSAEDAQALAARIGAAQPHWWARAARLGG